MGDSRNGCFDLIEEHIGGGRGLGTPAEGFVACTESRDIWLPLSRPKGDAGNFGSAVDLMEVGTNSEEA